MITWPQSALRRSQRGGTRRRHSLLSVGNLFQRSDAMFISWILLRTLQRFGYYDRLTEIYSGCSSVFAPLEIRRMRLQVDKKLEMEDLDLVISHDYKEADSFGQSVRDTFFQSDFFVRNDQSNDSRLKRDLTRYIEILFGVPVHTPTRHESAMYAAYSQSMGSACLSRQVGAAILSDRGEIIGLGGNDVPKFGGGLYSAEDADSDHRCFKWGEESSVTMTN